METTPANSLFSALSSVFPVEFRAWSNGDCQDLDALILVGQDAEDIRLAAACGLPVLAFPAGLTSAAQACITEYHLHESSALSASLRGHHFYTQEALPVTQLALTTGDDVIASVSGTPIWLRRREHGANVTLVAWPLPFFSRKDHIYENFQSSNFLRLLPLLQFIRDLIDQTDWQSPPTPACLLVDDPNLHSTTYGHLDFHQLVADAREQKFCVSVATVPLDCWGINRELGQLFRDNTSRFSILLHGNDHTYAELARPRSDNDNLALLAQALRRFQRLQEARLKFCRVMEAPHGSLSLAMLEPMARLGYEAVFASTTHLLSWNSGEMFPASLGAKRTLLGKRAATVIPRIRTRAGWESEVRLAAFLRQPIILAAHHWDFAANHHLAEEFAQIVNSLPDVPWASPTGVARACYQFLQIGEVLHIKLDSRLVDVPVPQSAKSVMIHRVWLKGAEEPELLVIRTQDHALFRAVSSADAIGPIPLFGSSRLQISSSLPDATDCNLVPPPPRRYWPFVRKLMVEVRDRSCIPIRPPRYIKPSETPESTQPVAAEVN